MRLRVVSEQKRSAVVPIAVDVGFPLRVLHGRRVIDTRTTLEQAALAAPPYSAVSGALWRIIMLGKKYSKPEFRWEVREL